MFVRSKVRCLTSLLVTTMLIVPAFSTTVYAVIGDAGVTEPEEFILPDIISQQ